MTKGSVLHELRREEATFPRVSQSASLLSAPPADSSLLLSSLFAGARAPAGGLDERDPGGQELLAQQDSGLPEELCLLFLQLHVPDPVLSEGGPCLGDPSLHLSVPCRMHSRAEEHKLKKQAAVKCSIPFPAGGKAGLTSLLGCK